MNELHGLGVAGQRSVEAVDPRFVVEGLLWSRQKTKQSLEDIRAQLDEGMTEDDARKLAMHVCAERGASKHWHKPYIRLGPGTARSFHEPLQSDYQLRSGDPFFIDIGPVWPEMGLDYEGDLGDSFVFGSNSEAERCVQAARALFIQAREYWRDQKTGEAIYRFLNQCAMERGYRLLERVDGHRLSDFPHHQYSKERLAHTDFVPSPSLWVLEVHIVHPDLPLGAFFEDIL